MCTLLLTVMSLASCSVDDSPDKQFNLGYNAQSGTPYSGKWDVSGKSIDKILMSEVGTTFMFGAIPTMQIVQAIFAGHAYRGRVHRSAERSLRVGAAIRRHNSVRHKAFGVAD